MRKAVFQTARAAVLGLGGLLVQDHFHGLSLHYAGRIVAIALFVVALVVVVITWERLWSTHVLRLPIEVHWRGRVIRGRKAAEEYRTLYRSAGKSALSHAATVTHHVLASMRPEGAFHIQYGQLVEEHVIGAAERAGSRLDYELGGRVPKSKTRETFIEFYIRYQLLISWMYDSARQRNVDLASNGNYLQWKECDRDFLKRLNELLTHPRHADTEAQIKGNRWPEGGVRQYHHLENFL